MNAMRRVETLLDITSSPYEILMVAAALLLLPLFVWNPELRAFRQNKRFQPFVTSLGLMKYWERYGAPDGCDLKDGKLTCH